MVPYPYKDKSNKEKERIIGLRDVDKYLTASRTFLTDIEYHIKRRQKKLEDIE
ncbi:MAG TPA: hypothetical protein VFS97_12540 [Nitrososphaeraceae archaeon]|nr:hypothetical protein [Nitrososphaeraceae archaeon]